MRAQLQLYGRLYDAYLSYRPTDSGGLLVLGVDVPPPYPPVGEHVLAIYLDGYRVTTVTVEVPVEVPEAPWGSMWLEQLIELSFAAVPLR